MTWSIFDELWGLDPGTWGEERPYRLRYTGCDCTPPINLYGNEEKLAVTSEIAGLKLEDLEISVKGRTLTIKGGRKTPELGEDEGYTCSERNYGDFERTVTLPFAVDPDKVDARYEGGVLLINLPRPETDRPRKIAIKTA